MDMLFALYPLLSVGGYVLFDDMLVSWQRNWASFLWLHGAHVPAHMHPTPHICARHHQIHGARQAAIDFRAVHGITDPMVRKGALLGTLSLPLFRVGRLRPTSCARSCLGTALAPSSAKPSH